MTGRPNANDLSSDLQQTVVLPLMTGHLKHDDRSLEER